MVIPGAYARVGMRRIVLSARTDVNRTRGHAALPAGAIAPARAGASAPVYFQTTTAKQAIPNPTKTDAMPRTGSTETMPLYSAARVTICTKCAGTYSQKCTLANLLSSAAGQAKKPATDTAHEILLCKKTRWRPQSRAGGSLGRHPDLRQPLHLRSGVVQMPPSGRCIVRLHDRTVETLRSASAWASGGLPHGSTYFPGQRARSATGR